MLVCSNTAQNQRLDVTIGKTRPIMEKTALDFWLTERHCLYERCGAKMCRFDINHKEWELRDLQVSINDIAYNAGTLSLGILPDKGHYNEKLDVVLWAKEEI